MKKSDYLGEALQKFVDALTPENTTSQGDGMPTKRQVNHIKRLIANTHQVYIQLSFGDGVYLLTKDKFNETEVSATPMFLSQRDAELIATILNALEKWNGRN